MSEIRFDKRKDKRLDALLFVNINKADGQNLGRGVIMDLSQHGMQIESEIDLEKEGLYSCQVEIPVVLKARVKWIKLPGQTKRFGLKFENMSFLDKFVFKRLLKGSRRTSKI